MLWRNEDLWHEGPSVPSPGSPLRSYEFWHRYLCLDDMHPHVEIPRVLPQVSRGAGWLDESWSARFRIARFENPTETVILDFKVAHGASALELVWLCTEPREVTTHILAHWDRASCSPNLFRWSEMQALVNVLEAGERPLTPSSPSLATLLLFPFTTIVEADDVAQCQNLIAAEIDGLGLLHPEETRLASTYTTKGPETSWRRDESVGWRLEWDRDLARENKTQPPYTLRAGGDESPDFPATKFLRLLAAVGVDDL